MTAIFHITHIGNLPSILQYDGIWCENIGKMLCDARVNIAHAHLKDRRTRKYVPRHRRPLTDYTPFYFAPRSPMLYAIYKERVEGYAEGQRPVLHLVSSVEDVAREGLLFAYTDGHAVIEVSEFFYDLSDLHRIDWEVIRARYWKDTQDDPDRARRRQAEFLVHPYLPWKLVSEVGTYDARTAELVSCLLTTVDHRPNVAVRRDWYF